MTDLKRWEPVVVDGLLECRNCGMGWSQHTMDGHCAVEEAQDEADQ